jgi:DNA helicase II / ATP-dependent DNA helicase PcrA
MSHNTTYSFTEDFAKLNAAQKKAVETIDGAVLVVAGPGTGKTQILAARIANILHKTDARPENILCMTYTEAGVTAMRKRLLQFIGTDAYRVNIHTFHSFCNRVIQENSEYFSIKELQPIGELEAINLMMELVDSFDKNHPLKKWRGEIYYEVKSDRLKNLFSLMKSEDWSAKFIEESVNDYIDDLPNRDGFTYKRKTGEFNVGDVNQKRVNEVKDKLDKTVAAAKEFDKYQQLKLERGFYDFDDMIHWVLKAFRANEDMLLNYQERFQYVLLDEYQDTNGAQNEIFKMLISYWENPNAFVVGDDDQSIFRFQGANLGNIIDFYQSVIVPAFPSEKERAERVIVMTENYRSSQLILDLAKVSIEKNEERLIRKLSELGLNKNLTARSKEVADSKVKPQIVEYYNTTHELLDIAKQIEELHQQGKNLNEVAVIYKQHKQAEELLHYLNQKDIPVRTQRKIDILKSGFTLKMLDILTYIQKESEIPHSREDLLFKILHFDFMQIAPLQIARLAFELRDNRYKNPKETWREALQKIQVRIDEDSIAKIEKFAKLSEKWQSDLQNMPVQIFFQTIIDDLGILHYILEHKEKVWLLQELKTFFDFIKNENQKNPALKLSELLEVITTMQEYKIALNFTRSTYAETAVNFTTAHSSKGLEFEYVFLIGTNTDNWDKPGNNRGFALPEGIIQKETKESVIEENRRLFYVAMTRAKKHLQISYPKADSDGKELTASMFVEEIKSSNIAEFAEKHHFDTEVLDFNLQQFLLPKEGKAEIIEAEYLKERLSKYNMSVTHLNSYLSCPLKFYYNNLLQIPSAKNGAMAFGSAVHNAIEELFKEMMKRNGEFPSAEEFVQMAERKMFGQEDSFTKKEYQQRLDYIREFLPEYYKQYVNEWNKNVNFEKKLHATYKGIDLTGALDKIEFSGKDIVVIDYKTGQFQNSKNKFNPPADKFKKPEAPTFEEQFGGDYWRQAVFYKILLDHSNDIAQQLWHYTGTEFDFVEPDKDKGTFHKQKVLVTPQDVETVKKQITETYENIQELKFDGCGKPECEWCSFQSKIHNDYPLVSLSEED